ncbi:MAG: methyl-accepting chemotaxis protein, partial [Polyangiaceae bacterium]
MTFTPKHWAAVALVALALAGSYVLKDQALPLMVVAVIGLFVIVLTSTGGGGESLAGLVEAMQRAANGEAVRPPANASEQVVRLFEEISTVAKQRKKELEAARARQVDVEEAERVLADLTRKLGEGVRTQIAAAEETAKQISEMAKSIGEIAQGVEALASSAEESSSSILEMTATSDEVAENVGELAGSVRETVSSIEEMAYSIKEVAKNVDALSLTAEETSSSMNQMDVSIDQVQSNANETARLSEEVALDAEKGAEAILKTISEIYRIKESSQEAV